MALAINISELLNGKVIEWERLEFKQGWNPEDVIHTLCAFANDINNWGGGYIILGIAEDKGRPVLPPAGLNPDQIDDRINQPSSINDLSLGLIRDYLQEVKSDLFEESTSMPFAALCRQMHLVKGPDEALHPVNVGLLFFSTEPHRYFERAWIEVVIRKDEAGKNFSEKYFKGPLHKQLREALSFIRTNIVSETIRKVSGQAEANRFYNFPFEAVKEALANAVYHKSYELGAPIEVQVWPDKIEVLSFPGPVPPYPRSMPKY